MSGAHSDKPVRVHWRRRDVDLFNTLDGRAVRVTACRKFALASVHASRSVAAVTCGLCLRKMTPALRAEREA